ncbi:MAG: sulfotransferase [Phycisphaerales bacterium]
MVSRLQFKRSLVLKMKLRAAWLRAVEARRRPGVEVHPFIVTGPPRSGTSLLNALLMRKSNVLVVNEPVVVSDPLLAQGAPARLVQGYVNTVARQAVRDGTLTTKVDPSSPGRPTTDTWNVGAARDEVTIEIDRSQPLCVGVKHPVSFMEFLDELLAGWSRLRAIIIVRDPWSTLRSWRETGFGWQPQIDDPSSGPWRKLYDLIPAVGDPLERRAHLWKILVERGVEQAQRRPGQALFLRYEELLERPDQVMVRLYRHIGAINPERPVDTSDVRPQARAEYRGLSETEVSMIRRICGDLDTATLRSSVLSSDTKSA